MVRQHVTAPAASPPRSPAPTRSSSADSAASSRACASHTAACAASSPCKHVTPDHARFLRLFPHAPMAVTAAARSSSADSAAPSRVRAPHSRPRCLVTLQARHAWVKHVRTDASACSSSNDGTLQQCRVSPGVRLLHSHLRCLTTLQSMSRLIIHASYSTPTSSTLKSCEAGGWVAYITSRRAPASPPAPQPAAAPAGRAGAAPAPPAPPAAPPPPAATSCTCSPVDMALSPLWNAILVCGYLGLCDTHLHLPLAGKQHAPCF